MVWLRTALTSAAGVRLWLEERRCRAANRCGMTTSSDHERQPQRFDRRLLVVYVISVPLFITLSLFLPAGTLAWVRGWLFVAVFLLAATLAGVYVWRVNPELYAARSRIHEGTKHWDRILIAFLIPPMAAIFAVAALDGGRFHWFPVPWWVCAVGYGLFLTGFAITVWAEAVNKFFELGVRIQTDRGHKVIDTGPYAIVRHPGYVGAIILCAGVALSLGSLWALIPVCLSSVLLIYRTWREDLTLQAELPGYAEYSKRVRYRLVPWVW
jgi:protein-S-isoprenylcysteine O-methyltransferase Ste14